MVWYRLYGPVAMVPLVAEHIVVRAVCAQAHSMKELIKDNMEAMEYLVSEVEFFNKRLGDPEIEVLLALKDELRIPDDWWQQVVSTFNLGRGGNLHQIEKLRQRLNSALPVNPTPGR
jgi:hypothetical protein